MHPNPTLAADSPDEVVDTVDEKAIAEVMHVVPLGAGVLAGAAVALLVLGYLLICAAQPHGRGRVQARRARADLSEIHLRCVRGQARGTRRAARSRCRARGPRRIPRRQHLLGAAGGALGLRQVDGAAAGDRPPRRRRHERDRARQRLAQKRAGQGFRPPRPRQAV